MKWSAKTVDRVAACAIYLMLCIMVVWAGSALINYSMENKFYNDYVYGWKLAGERYLNKQGAWPVFKGTNHVEYMDQLVRMMKETGVDPPQSNTKKPYTYILDRLWKDEEHIFILLLREKMVIYGMSRQTYNRLDERVDGSEAMGKGLFKGKVSKDGCTIIGIWGMS